MVDEARKGPHLFAKSGDKKQTYARKEGPIPQHATAKQSEFAGLTPNAQGCNPCLCAIVCPRSLAILLEHLFYQESVNVEEETLVVLAQVGKADGVAPQFWTEWRWAT